MYTVWAEWEGGGLGRGIGVVEGSEGTWEREEAKRVRPLCLIKFTDFQLLYWLYQLVW